MTTHLVADERRGTDVSGDVLPTGMLTDRYELTMLDSAILAGTAANRAVFEVFARTLPAGRRYGVVAGTQRVVDALGRFRFTAADLTVLSEFVSPAGLAVLADYRFAGTVWGYPEGELYFANSPLLRIEGTFADTLVETLVLGILNHDCAVASAASRMVAAANDKPLIEMGGRRTDEWAAAHAARAAFIAGFASTSNMWAGRHYGLPTAGTAAHSFTLAHRSEREAFDALIARLGTNTTLLVDTYDTPVGIANAVAAARAAGAPGPGAIRIDSGDLVDESRRARAQLDALGACSTRIIVSGDLDEYAIAALEAADAPVDMYGVGTQVVTGSGHPAAGMVFKLVAVADSAGPGAPLRPVAKRQIGKATVAGPKAVWRTVGRDGHLIAEHVVANTLLPRRERSMQTALMVAGEPVFADTVDAARARHTVARSLLPVGATRPDAGAPAIPTLAHRPAPGTTSALIVVDVQPDFCEGGPLAAVGGHDLAEHTAAFLGANADHFGVVVATRDAHVDPGDHFVGAGTEPDYATTWPVHCVDGTPGAELHPAIAAFPFDAVLAKGAYAASTNGFEGVTADGASLGEVLRHRCVTDVFVAGLVYEVCDADTALGAIAEGFDAWLITDLCVALDAANVPAVDKRLRAAGVTVITADEATRVRQ